MLDSYINGGVVGPSKMDEIKLIHQYFIDTPIRPMFYTESRAHGGGGIVPEHEQSAPLPNLVMQ